MKIRLSLVLVLVAPSLLADPPRTALVGAPVIGGRKIERFVARTPIEIDHQKLTGSLQLRIPAGRLLPVAQDKKGVFYQAEEGILRIYLFQRIYGGVYVLKSRPGRMLAYTGDARLGSKSGVDKDWAYLSADIVNSLHPEPSHPPK